MKHSQSHILIVDDNAENVATLQDILSREGYEISSAPDPLVARLPRQPGQKDGRFAHLLSGEIDLQAIEQAPASPSSRRTSLEEKVEALTAEVEKLKEQFEQFRKQFE